MYTIITVVISKRRIIILNVTVSTQTDDHDSSNDLNGFQTKCIFEIFEKKLAATWPDPVYGTRLTHCGPRVKNFRCRQEIAVG